MNGLMTMLVALMLFSISDQEISAYRFPNSNIFQGHFQRASIYRNQQLVKTVSYVNPTQLCLHATKTKNSSKQIQSSKKPNIFLRIVSKIWSLTFGWIFSKIFGLFSRNQKKNISPDIDDTIKKIKNIAKQEEKVKEDGKEDNVISVTISNNYEDEASFAPKVLDKKELAAARKVVERKLEEMKSAKSAPVKPAAAFATTNSVESSNILPPASAAAAADISLVANTSEVIMEPVKDVKEVVVEAVENKVEELLSSFPEIVSEKADDHTYMSYQYGAVDPHSIFEFKKGSSTAAPSSSEIADVSDADNSWNKIKSAGRSGTIAYVITELGFWAIAPVLVMLYQFLQNGSTNALSDKEQQVPYLTEHYLILSNFSPAPRCRSSPFPLDS